MRLFEQIKADRIAAMKEKDTIRKNVLSCLIGDSSKLDKNPSDVIVMSTIKKFIKNIDGTMDLIRSKSDAKSIAEYHKMVDEISILKQYCPTQLSREELKSIIESYIQVTETNSIGAIQKYLKSNYDGSYNGGDVNIIIKEIVG